LFSAKILILNAILQDCILHAKISKILQYSKIYKKVVEKFCGKAQNKFCKGSVKMQNILQKYRTFCKNTEPSAKVL